MREGWTYKKLGEICEIICGQDYKKVESPDGKYPIYGTGGIMGYANDFKCPAYSIIVGRKGNINNPIYVEENFWNVDTAFGIVPSKACLVSKFFFYFCQNYDFSKHNVAVTIPSLRRIDLLKIPIPVPPLSEQQRIVNELDLLSSIIDKKKAQLKEYDHLAQSIFYDIFGDPVSNEKGWEVKTMQDVCSHIVDCPHSTPKKVEYETQYPCIRTSELKGGTVQWDTMQYLDEVEYKNRIARLKPLAGDIVFGREGSIGDAVILPNGYFFSLGQRTMLLRANNSLISNVFLHRTILSEWVKRQIDAVNVSSTVAHVNIKDFKLFEIPLPPLSLQQSFASKIEAIEQQKALVQQSITEAETLFNSRMDYYFN